VSGVAQRETGLASGLINTSQQVGGALGLAILSTIATARTSAVMAAAGGNPSELARALTVGFQGAFAAGAGLALFGLMLAFVLVRQRGVGSRIEATGSTAEAG
jgi:hypothetical protein